MKVAPEHLGTCSPSDEQTGKTDACQLKLYDKLNREEARLTYLIAAIQDAPKNNMHDPETFYRR